MCPGVQEEMMEKRRGEKRWKTTYGESGLGQVWRRKCMAMFRWNKSNGKDFFSCVGRSRRGKRCGLQSTVVGGGGVRGGWVVYYLW
jgi:hypothetical protein